MSCPRYARGMRMCSPTQSVTSRPERAISSASCSPRRRCADDEHAARCRADPGGGTAPVVRVCTESRHAVARRRARSPRRVRRSRGRPRGSATRRDRSSRDSPRRRQLRPRSRSSPVRTGAAMNRAYPVDELDDLGHRHEAVGIGAVVRVAGQPALPVRRQQAQRVPALVPPRVRRPRRARARRDRWRARESWRLIASPEWPAPTTTTSTVPVSRARREWPRCVIAPRRTRRSGS